MLNQDPHRRAVTLLERIAERSSRTMTPVQLQAAAALLVDLWAAAERHGVGADHWGRELYLPRAAYDTMTAPARRPPRRERLERARREREGVNR